MEQPRCRIVATRIEVGDNVDPRLCEEACPSEALRVKDRKLSINVSACIVCLACMAICGSDNIRVISDWVCT